MKYVIQIKTNIIQRTYLQDRSRLTDIENKPWFLKGIAGWMLSFKPAFSLSCFTFIKRLFSSSSLSVISVVSSVYLRLLILLLVILIPACASSSLVFHTMYSTIYKIDKDLPYHTVHYSQYLIIIYNGKESDKEKLYMYICINYLMNAWTNTL